MDKLLKTIESWQNLFIISFKQDKKSRETFIAKNILRDHPWITLVEPYFIDKGKPVSIGAHTFIMLIEEGTSVDIRVFNVPEVEGLLKKGALKF